jgi:signal transduction histidine kinase
VTAVEVFIGRAAGRGPHGRLGDRGGRPGARMRVSGKESASPAVAFAGRHGALLGSLSRLLPSGLARRGSAAGDADRQRIERDLHDGLQQRLTGLRIRAALAAESFQERGDTDASAASNGFGEEVRQAIEEVRAFARGVYPLLLASEGLGAALVSVSRYAPAPIMVSARGIRRCRPEVESAVYFTCLAAIDNAAKHAGPAEVYVRAWDSTQAVHFTVCDTGCGFDPNRTPSGAGLRNMHDRIAAVGGTLAIHSTPSHGTRLRGSVPDPWPDTTPERRPPGARATPPADLGGVPA